MPARQKKKNINKPLQKKDGIVQKQRPLPAAADEYIDEEERLQLLDNILTANRDRIQTEELDEDVDWDLLKKKKRKPNKKHTRKEHILQIAPGINLTRRQILTILCQLEIENARLKSIPTPRIARACKATIKSSPKFNQNIHEHDDKYKGHIENMNQMMMTKAALERVTIHVEKKLENMFRWAWVMSLSQKKRTLSAENFLTAKELMEGQYDINKSVNFNQLKRRYGTFTEDDLDLEKRLEEAGLHSIDQIYSILENADITQPQGNLFAPTRLDMALREKEVKEKLSDKGIEFIARLKQQQPATITTTTVKSTNTTPSTSSSSSSSSASSSSSSSKSNNTSSDSSKKSSSKKSSKSPSSSESSKQIIESSSSTSSNSSSKKSKKKKK